MLVCQSLTSMLFIKGLPLKHTHFNPASRSYLLHLFCAWVTVICDSLYMSHFVGPDVWNCCLNCTCRSASHPHILEFWPGAH